MKNSFNSNFYNKIFKLKAQMLNFSKKYKFFTFCFHPKYYKTVGALGASSKALSKTLASVINPELSPKYILEVGAGTGPITKYILRSLKSEDNFDIIEITKEFLQDLQEICKNYPQCKIFNSSILDFTAKYKYDYIISSLPFYSFSPNMVKQILDNYKELIKPSGTIVYFQYMFTDYINKFKQGKHRHISQLKTFFHHDFYVNKKYEYRNIFPVIIWILKPKKSFC